MLLAAGVVAWRNHQLSERQAQSMRFGSALELAREGKDADAAKLFAVIAKEGGGYGTLAAFEAAEQLAKSDDKKAAIAAYDELAGRSGLDPELRDLATLYSVMLGLGDGDPKSAIERLKPLAAPGALWRSTALELTATAQLKSGDAKTALESYKSLADDLTAPQGVRARAAEMVAALSP
jgi:hypothetical protein